MVILVFTSSSLILSWTQNNHPHPQHCTVTLHYKHICQGCQWILSCQIQLSFFSCHLTGPSSCLIYPTSSTSYSTTFQFLHWTPTTCAKLFSSNTLFLIQYHHFCFSWLFCLRPTYIHTDTPLISSTNEHLLRAALLLSFSPPLPYFVNSKHLVLCEISLYHYLFILFIICLPSLECKPPEGRDFYYFFDCCISIV